MQSSIEIPDDIAQTLCLDESELSQAAVEALAIEGYRVGRLSEHQLSRMLGLDSRLQVHAFLKQRGIFLNYSLEDLKQDIKTLELEGRLSA